MAPLLAVSRTVAYVLGDGLASLGKVLELASASGLMISELRMVTLGQHAAGLVADR